MTIRRHLISFILLFLFILGLSLKSQELTAIFLGVRVFCSFFIEGDIHTVLDFVTLVSTLWVIYMIRFKLKSTYAAELDNMPIYYVVMISLLISFCCVLLTSVQLRKCLQHVIHWCICTFTKLFFWSVWLSCIWKHILEVSFVCFLQSTM